ncbi:unnamed protein product [Agarophyton chilense]
MTRSRNRQAHFPPAQLRSFDKRLLRLSRLAKRWCLHHPVYVQRTLLLALSLVLLAVLTRFASLFHGSRHEQIRVQSPTLRRFQLVPNLTDSLRDEQTLARKLCARHILSSQMEELRTCNQFEHTTAGKVVALVELRNVHSTLYPFLSSLSTYTHSIIALDDHSTDETRNQLLRSPHVELILNRTGEWRRDELADRQMLLEAGRRVGGTHFVLLDYDEFVSHNCVPWIRDEILKLRPGESLFIPWVETWKTPYSQRVMKHDPQMNFLTRRQTVIFADDRFFSYSADNSLARTLSNNASLHVLRCPRSVCPPPGAYKGASTNFEFPPSVKVLRECRILEMRFLNFDNVLLKAAWYEALGRVLGAADGVTSGKMMTRMFSSSEQLLAKEGVFLSEVNHKWLADDAYDVFKPFQFIETWRASELLHWIGIFGADHFRKLPVMNSIHFGELRLAMRRARLQDAPLRMVPRRKSDVIVFAVENQLFPALSRLLDAMGFESLVANNESSAHSTNQGRQFVHIRAELDAMRQRPLPASHTARVYVSFAHVSEQNQLMLLRYAKHELRNVHVLLVFADWHSAMGDTELSEMSRAMANEAGSHVHLIDMSLQAFGSFAALRWLSKRICSIPTAGVGSRISDEQLLALAEQNHAGFEAMRERGAVSSHKKPHDSVDVVERLLPVARLMFSLNVGRSGSRYLADVLDTADDPIIALHEPRCSAGKCSGGGAMRMQEILLKQSYEERQRIKIPMIMSSVASVFNLSIARAWHSRTVECSMLERGRWVGVQEGATDLKSSRPVLEVSGTGECVVHEVRDVVFVETNPNFKAWMYDVVLEQFPKRGYEVTVVVVRRYVAAVVCSLYETGYFTKRDGYNWMETAAGVNSRVRLKELTDDSKLDAVEKLVSYVANAEAVFREVLRRYVRNGERVRAVQVRSERIFETGGMRELMEELGLSWSPRTTAVAGVVRDKYLNETGGRAVREMRVEECERRIEQFEITLSKEARTVVRDLLSEWTRLDD